MGPLLNPGMILDDARVLPPVFLVLSGSGDVGLDGSVRRIHLTPLPAGTIREILEGRVRQTGQIWTPEALGKVTDILATRGNGLSVMDEVLTASV